VRQGSIPLKWAEGEQLMTLKPKPELELTKDAVHLEPLRKHLEALHHRYLSRHAERERSKARRCAGNHASTRMPRQVLSSPRPSPNPACTNVLDAFLLTAIGPCCGGMWLC